jgi:hypothetical protein
MIDRHVKNVTGNGTIKVSCTNIKEEEEMSKRNGEAGNAEEPRGKRKEEIKEEGYLRIQ